MTQYTRIATGTITYSASVFLLTFLPTIKQLYQSLFWEDHAGLVPASSPLSSGMGNTQTTAGINRQASGTDKQNSGNADVGRDEEAELEQSGHDLDSDTDLSRLFDVDDVHFFASNVSASKDTVYERCYQELKECFERMEMRTDIQRLISFTRFCDMLKFVEVSHVELTQMFNLLDYEARGSLEATLVLKALRKNKRIQLNDDLNSVLERFIDCSWVPGFLDVYIDQKESFKQHALRILDFLLRNRVSVSSGNCQAIELFEATSKLREGIINSRINSLDFHGLDSTASLKEHTKPVLKKEDSVSGDDLLPEEVKTEELQQDKVQAGDALLLWYTRLVTTTARASLPLAPELLNTALAHTRTMLIQLVPLSLSHDSEERPSFLNVDCFHEMGSLIQLFPEKTELLSQSLSFHLVCGSVSEILHCLTELNVSSVQIDCSNLQSSIDQARRRLLEKNARSLKVNLLGCDAEGTTDNEPGSALETNWKQPAFKTKSGKTKANFLFKSPHWAEFTKIKIKGTFRSALGSSMARKNSFEFSKTNASVKALESRPIAPVGTHSRQLGPSKRRLNSAWSQFVRMEPRALPSVHCRMVESEKSAPSHGFIFVLPEWHADAQHSSLKKELGKFTRYDKWTESDYKSQSLKGFIPGSYVTNEPVAYFSTKNRDEVDVVLDNPIVGKFVLVKFVEPRGKCADHLGIVGIKFYGVHLTTGLGLLEQQISRSLSTANPLESNQMTIQSVLRFLLLVFCCQAKKKQAVIKDIYHSCSEVFFKHTVDPKTGIFIVESPGEDYETSVVLGKQPFSEDFPYFEIEFANRGRFEAVSIGAGPSDLRTGLQPGLVPQSIGYFAADGRLWANGSLCEGTRTVKCTTGDIMGCGVEYEADKIKTLYFTKNGERVHDYASDFLNPLGGLFPVVGIARFGEKARIVSKEPSAFSAKHVEKARTSVATGSEFINPNHLDLSNVTIETLWKTYKQFPEKLNQSLFLQLFNSTLQLLKSSFNNFKIASEIFDHLCHLSDQKNENVEDDIICRSAKDVIRDGLDLFFPCREARPKMLLDLLHESSESPLTGSKLILFQSLCHYFSTVDLRVLMPLPAKPSHLPEDFNSSNLLSIMGKLLSISFRDSMGLFELKPESPGSSTVNRRPVSAGSETLSGRKKSEHLFHLSKLLNQLQMRLFAWVSQELSKPQEATDDVDRLEKLVIHYCCQLITPKAEQLLTRMKMLKSTGLKLLLPELDTSFLSATLRELVLLLSELATKLSSHRKTKLLENLKPVMMTIRKLLFKLPDLLPSLDENNQGEVQMEKELRSWEVDSPRTDRPDRVNLTFSCARATHFDVEFDKRCETEISDEYLVFDDSKTNRRSFVGLAGRGTWPMKIRFEGTSVLNFTYNKDVSDKKSAGYNFKVKAMQTKVSDFHWLYDVYLSFCRLFGRIAASVLDKTPVLPHVDPSHEKLEMQMYRSELWTTIFRGGLVAKKFERSLSGNYETADQSDVATFLNDVAEFKSGKAKAFINRCKSHHTRNHDIGGEEIDRVIASVFAALLWHTQSLRHDVNIYLRNEFNGKISEGIHEAYSSAENLRLFLAERRQTMRKELEEQHERGEEEDGKAKEAAVYVVHLVEEKSRFLLHFSGLSRVALKPEEVKRKFETRRSRQQSIGPRLSHETSIDLSISVESKYPSFRLVFDFIQDIAWTKDKVEDLLKKRYINSESLWKTYSFMSEFFRTISSEHLKNDISCTVFIRELLASQDKFGRHYADGIDGCGLGMEANVRSSYYGLMRHLVTMLRKDMTASSDNSYYGLMHHLVTLLRKHMTASSDKSKPAGSEVLANCVLHLLDIDWQAYDLPFVVELRLPELYFTLAKDYLPPVFEEPLTEFGVDETEEDYHRNLEWALEMKKDSSSFMSSKTTGADYWLVKLIRSRFQKLELGTEFGCDECGSSLSTNYYHCLDCYDVDICKACYDNGIIPSTQEHNGEHNLVLLRYLCKGCNGFIIATRCHCNECDDFDLCKGCYIDEHFPAGSSHNTNHDVSRIRTPIVHQSEKVTIKNPMSGYFHLHSWMLFSTTALSTLDFLMSKASEEKPQRVDENYVYSARQIFSNCLETAVDYLVRELSTNVVDIDQSVADVETTQKKTLELTEESLVSKIIGLIAALIPANNQNPMVKEVTEVLSSEKFLLTLFDIARGKKVQDVISRHMALGLLGKLLQQMNISSEASQSLKSSESGEVMIVDPKAVNLVQNLFDFGADCLKRIDMELAKSTSQVLNGLQTNPTWTQLLNHQFSLTVDLLHSTPTLSSIFALFALTGFPEVLTVGTLVTHLEKDKEVIRSIVINKKSDEATCTVIELASRKKRQIKDTLLDVVTNNKSSQTENQVSQFIEHIIDTVNQQVIPGLAVDALSLGQLALVTKASLQYVQNDQSKVYVQLYENSFLQCLSHLASLGTGLPKCLLLRDIEVLSLELNKRSQSEPDLIAEPEANATIAEEDIDTDNNDNHDDDDEDNDDHKHDDDEANAHERSQAEPELIAITAGENETADNNELSQYSDHQLRRMIAESGVHYLMTLDRDYLEFVLLEIRRRNAAELVREKQKRKEILKKQEIDTGVGIGRDIFDLLHAEIEIDECIEEVNPEKPSLISKSEDEDEEMARKRKEESKELTEKLCSFKEKGLLTKVNRALAILYARKLLMALVSECSKEKAVEFFAAGGPSECKHITSVFFILPLLAGLEEKQTLEKVVAKVVDFCQPDDIVSIAVASSLFVAATGGQMVTVSKQLPPPAILLQSGQNAASSNCNVMDVVYIPGATALKVKLDKSSCAERDVELVFSSSSDLTKDRQCFSGRSSENWNAFTIKGDHLYCTITGPDVALVQSSYHFKVTGIVSFSGHFDVGYLALSAIFDKPETARLLPFGRLWKLLISLVNRSAKTQRMKAIQLLLKLLSLQTKSRGCEELFVDLSLLKGLFQMYQKMMENTKDSTEVQPVLVLALTELFYVAQKTAEEWNAVHSLMTSEEGDGSIAQE